MLSSPIARKPTSVRHRAPTTTRADRLPALLLLQAEVGHHLRELGVVARDQLAEIVGAEIRRREPDRLAGVIERLRLDGLLDRVLQLGHDRLGRALGRCNAAPHVELDRIAGLVRRHDIREDRIALAAEHRENARTAMTGVSTRTRATASNAL